MDLNSNFLRKNDCKLVDEYLNGLFTQYHLNLGFNI